VTDGLLIIDKPAGMTSHDVVSRVRRLAGTRKVGHAGTLDPMATGVLVLGVGRATRLLTYIVGADKVYQATVRLGQSTITDDAEGDPTATVPAGHLTDAEVRGQLAEMTGEVDQVPSSVSAIKIKGVRSYHRVRAGEEVSLPPRRVRIDRIDVLDIRHENEIVDVDVEVACSSGTYIRAIARDLGSVLLVGGHLTALRRTAVGQFTLAQAQPLEPPLRFIPLAEALERIMPVVSVEAEQARVVKHGGPLVERGRPGPYGVIGPDGAPLAILSDREGKGRPEIVFAEPINE
jgi:tRNA pseudouridine55 synthase